MGGSGDKKQLGKILLKQRLVSSAELVDGFDEPRASATHQDRVSDSTDRVSDSADRASDSTVELLKALSDRFGVPAIDLDQVVIPLEGIDIVPPDIARLHLILPIVVKDDRLVLAMANPAATRAIDEIEFVTGRRVYPYVTLEDSLSRAITEAYRLREAKKAYYVGANVAPELLASRGISLDETGERRAIRADDPTPGVLVDRHVTDSTPPMDSDELGLLEPSPAALRAPPVPSATGLDDAFGSRVGPLPDEPRERPSNPRILVVDDEDDIRKLLVRVFSQKGYEVIEAARGVEALTLVRDRMPDVILLDAMLPEVHGFDICRRIKGSQRYGHIPIIMVSAIYRGWRVAEDLRQSYGVAAFLEKPFKIGDVIAHVESALRGRTVPPSHDGGLSGDAQEYLERAMAAYRDGDADTAIAILKEGVAIDPLAFQLHYHLGLIWGRRDNAFEAIHELERAVDLSPRHFAALKNLAVLYQRVGFKHKAIEIWERALSNAPDEETRHTIKDHLMSLL